MSAPSADLLNHQRPWLLVFAHPGHELRAYHVVERVRPSVAVLTDGSGSTAIPRLAESRELLLAAGARPASMFGPLSDGAAYAALMSGDARPFITQLNQLADVLVSDGVGAVLVDAAEGYNPVHDVCHWMARAAVARARQFGAPIALFEVDLVSHPDSSGDGLRVTLDEAAFRRKLDAISRYDALKAEAEAAFERYGKDAFRVEFLRRVAEGGPPPPSWVPYYEQVGEARVRSGLYTSVLRYGSHVRPVIDALLASVEPAMRPAAELRAPHE
jgi:nucleotide-binding universal stress UspA family protein